MTVDPCDPEWCAADTLPHDTARAALPTLPEAPPTLPTGGRIEVKRVRTPLTEERLVEVARVGHVLTFGLQPSPARLAVARAHLFLEHGRGQAIHCNDIGNIDAAATWNGPVFPLVADEVLAGVRGAHRKMLRAFASPELGAAGYWRYLAEHCESALAFYDAGDGAGAARALSRCGYFTENVETVAHSMRLIVAEVYPPR